MKSIIHVNQSVIAKNRRDGTHEPPLIVRNYKGRKRCSEVNFANGRVVYRPHDPLDCGARLWIETQEPVEIIR